ncbi:hypothetical protein CgunFtcFv8_024038 [Champsocephalus gunnari]|uniref:Cytochrome P450 7B1 n=2 Tax=Champsocephalus gunnari TaxID=52237 RepID=A0AAN8DLM2_CHAGU|nr:hypothetical protein CgunFtcFv8_024038 [Champsocephalus gunnari]
MMMSPVLLLLLLGLLCFICLRRKRRPGEAPLVSGWIPFLGRALDFGRDAQAFLQEQRRRHGDVFTVHLAGKYLTFILDPLLYPSVVRQGRQLDFHQFADTVAPPTFGYPPVRKGFPGLSEQIIRSFQLMQGEHLGVLTESMMGNLMLVLRQDHLCAGGGGWTSGSIFDFCNSVMFEATFLTIFGGPERGRRHEGMEDMREDFQRFDRMFPLLIAQVPIGLLGRTRAVRSKLIDRFLPDRMSSWTGTSQLIKTRSKLLEQHASLRDTDKGAHHFAILWASVGNTVPACFWVLYFLLRDPEALQAVRQEVLEVLRQSGGEFSPEKDLALSREQLDSMVLLESSISEGLRLSSASTNIRVSQEDFSLRLNAERSVSVRKGDVIALYPQSMHMDPDIYQDPQSFRYDRFVQDGRVKTDFYKSGQKLKFFLMPFGSGTSMCPGRYFAVNEIKQFLSLVLLYLDLDLQPGQNRVSLDYGRAGLGILLPNADVRFHYRLRAASQSPAE